MSSGATATNRSRAKLTLCAGGCLCEQGARERRVATPMADAIFTALLMQHCVACVCALRQYSGTNGEAEMTVSGERA